MSCVELLASFPYVEFHFYFELSHINCGFGLKAIKTAVHNYKFLYNEGKLFGIKPITDQKIPKGCSLAFKP